MPGTTGETLNGWQELASSLSANTAEIPHLEGHRTRLADLLKQAQDLTTQQAALTASKQEVTKKLQGVMDVGAFPIGRHDDGERYVRAHAVAVRPRIRSSA